ncbi:MAG: hypothetical protein ACJAYU_001742 [Bradymonadia bacterium]|jgi:hypothetical protein
MTDLTLRCSCGSFTARIGPASPKLGSRIECLCDDCQAFAEFLGRVDEIFSSARGTEIYQTTTRRYRIESGAEHIACVSLKERGLKRRYTSCCNTPIGNTMATAKIAFIGVPRLAINTTDEELDQTVGPIVAKVNGRFARGEMQSDVHARAPIGMLARWLRVGLGAQIRGEAKPHPFFSDEREPVVATQVLTAAERAALENV